MNRPIEYFDENICKHIQFIVTPEMRNWKKSPQISSLSFEKEKVPKAVYFYVEPKYTIHLMKVSLAD